MSYQTISAAELRPQLEAGQKVIDVRTPAEYRAAHVSGAELCPLDALDTSPELEMLTQETPVYILCQSGKRAAMAGARLVAAGHKHIFVVDGGTEAAKKTGPSHDLRKGRHLNRATSPHLRRRTRSRRGDRGPPDPPGFTAVPVVIGSGLVFAGVTDTCGMAAALSKMPWNR